MFEPGRLCTNERASRRVAALGSTASPLVWLLLALLSAAGCVANEPPDSDAGVGTSTVVVLPDTQFYSCGYPEIFAAQTRFIAQQRHARDIRVVLHTGDIVDSNLEAQWSVADTSMHALDGQVPYLVTSGNHDLVAERASLMPDYFDARLLDAFDPPGSAYAPPRVDNSFAVVRVGGRDWLFLGLEFGPRDAVVAWADEVLRAHAELPAVVFTHAYLYSDGTRYDRRHTPPQPYHPDSYAFTPTEGINDGEDLWRKLIEPNENVRLVLSGHVIPIGTARAQAQRASGSVVHEVLANYQLCGTCPCAEVEGGGGYLRLLEFDSETPRIRVTTYSPHYDRYLRDDQNQFELALEP